MRESDVRRVGVVGGGVMGGGIAQVLALGGYEVVLRDLTPDILETTRQELVDRKWGLKRSVERGKLGFDQAVEAIARVSFTARLADLADVDLVIEAVPENLELKQKVFDELDGVVKPGAIFASNTSGFVIQEIAERVSGGRKTRFVGMHFSNPVPVMQMCEIVHTPDTTSQTVDVVRAVAVKCGNAVSLVRDAPGTYGFILNRVFAAARREAQAIVDAGIATPEDVDRAMITGRNWPAGFFGARGGIGKQW